MTSHRAMVTIPARNGHGPERGPEASSAALPIGTPTRRGRAPAPAAKPAAPCPGVDGRPVEIAERYLAPALKAAAAARARTAQIRAATSVRTAGTTRPSAPEWPGRAPDPVPAAAALRPVPAAPPEMAEIMAAWTSRGLRVALGTVPVPAPTAAPAAPTGRGLSVAEAAVASRIAFRPLQRAAPARAADPVNGSRPPAGALPGAPGSNDTGPAKAATAVAPPAVEAPAPRLPVKAAAAGPAPAVTRPGIARLLAGEAVRSAAPERPVRPQRFTKTMAELQRHQAATRPDEPWGNVVPRPAVPQPNPAPADSRWSRLWPRR